MGPARGAHRMRIETPAGRTLTARKTNYLLMNFGLHLGPLKSRPVIAVVLKHTTQKKKNSYRRFLLFNEPFRADKCSVAHF
jgi:hypothetical protein